MLTIEEMRAIDRDLRHLDGVMARVRDVKTISTILSTACGTDHAAARALSRFLIGGQADVK